MKRLTYHLIWGVFALWALILSSERVFAAATVTTFSTGNVSSDSQGSGTSVTMPNIVVTEGLAGDIVVSTHVWTAPTGYVFDTSSVPNVAYTGAGLAGAATATMASTTMTIATTAASTGAGTMTIGSTTAIKTRVSTGCAMAAAANLTHTSGTITGITNGTTNFGTWTQIPGAAAKLVVSFPGQTAAPSCSVPGSAASQQTVSQSFNLNNITAMDQFFNTATGYTGLKNLTFTTTNNVKGAFTTAVTFSSGVSTGNITTTFLQPAGVSTQLTVSEGSITGPISSSIFIADVGGGSTAPVTPPAPAPSTPTNLQVTGATDNSVSLSWAAVSGAAGYNVYSNTFPTGTFFLLTASQPSTTTLTYTDKNLMRDITYYYVVTAINAQGRASTYSNVVSATPRVAVAVVPAAPATPATPAVPSVTPAVPAIPATPAIPALPYPSAKTAVEIQANITFLIEEVKKLQAKLLTEVGAYTRDLTIGSTGDDVVSLQSFLETKGFLTIPQGIAKGYFGNLTKEALAKYQKSVGISPAAGYFGPKTRAKISQ